MSALLLWDLALDPFASGNVSKDDVGDDDLAGVLIILNDRNGILIATTATDNMGDSVFYDLPAGKYTLTETKKLLAGVPLVKDLDGGNFNAISVVTSWTRSAARSWGP